MNTQKSVYNRLFSKEEKTELETHKVELGAIQDLNKLNAKMEKSVSEIKKATDNTKKAITKAKAAEQKMFDDAENEWEKADKVFGFYDQYDSDYEKLSKEITKMAKDLGLDVKSVKQLETAKKLINEIESEATKLDSSMIDLTRYFTN